MQLTKWEGDSQIAEVERLNFNANNLDEIIIKIESNNKIKTWAII